MNILTDEQLELNKIKFINILESIKREGFDKEDLVHQLEISGFFESPATTKYYNAYKGGLCEHCLNMYENMVSLFSLFPNVDTYDVDSIKIVGLFHDIYKLNYYKEITSNKKEYVPTGCHGKLKDEGGEYNWVPVKSYVVKDANERFIFGSNGETSEFRIRQYLNLTMEESMAIINLNTRDDEINLEAMSKHPLLTIAKAAKLLACYVNNK